MTMMTYEDFARQIVDQMSYDDSAAYDRADWAEGIGMQMHGDEPYSRADVLDAVDELLELITSSRGGHEGCQVPELPPRRGGHYEAREADYIRCQVDLRKRAVGAWHHGIDPG